MELEDLLPFNTASLLTLIDTLKVLAVELLVVPHCKSPLLHAGLVGAPVHAIICRLNQAPLVT